jgi:hypothetical protein
MPSRVAWAAIAFACTLASCGPRDGAYNPSNFQVHEQVAPRDVALPANFSDGPFEFGGLYAEGAGVLSCCWIAPHATLLVKKRGPASTLVAGLRIPNVPRFANGQTVAISFPGSTDPPVRARIAAGGQRMIKVPIPSRLRGRTGLIPVEVTSAVDYVPSRDAPPTRTLFTMLHLRAAQSNTDVRSLGAILLYMYFQ